MKLKNQLNVIKNNIKLNKTNNEINNLVKIGRAKFFDEDFYNRFDGMYYNALPINFYLQRMSMGNCFDASAILALAMGKDCFVCRGELSKLNCINDESFCHGWVEQDNKVFDTTFKLIMDIKDYYNVFQAVSYIKTNQEQFFEVNQELSDWTIRTKEDYESKYYPFAYETVLAASQGEQLKLDMLNNMEESDNLDSSKYWCKKFLSELPNIDKMPHIDINDLENYDNDLSATL